MDFPLFNSILHRSPRCVMSYLMLGSSLCIFPGAAFGVVFNHRRDELGRQEPGNTHKYGLNQSLSGNLESLAGAKMTRAMLPEFSSAGAIRYLARHISVEFLSSATVPSACLPLQPLTDSSQRRLCSFATIYTRKKIAPCLFHPDRRDGRSLEMSSICPRAMRGRHSRAGETYTVIRLAIHSHRKF